MESPRGVSRRRFLGTLGLTAGTVAVAGAGGATCAAVLAPSAHNTQPWLFRVAPSRIDLFADPARNIGTMDPLRRELQISLGCALENVVLAAPRHCKVPTVSLMPTPPDQTHVANRPRPGTGLDIAAGRRHPPPAHQPMTAIRASPAGDGSHRWFSPGS